MKEIFAVSALYVPIYNKSYVWYVRIFGLNRFALSLLVVLSFLSVKSWQYVKFNVLFACFSKY